jgi:Transcriptional regulator PadR-like family/MacB-like periplasmic core domain
MAFHGRCGNAYIREERLAQLLGGVVDKMQLPERVAKAITVRLHSSQAELEQARGRSSARLLERQRRRYREDMSTAEASKVQRADLPQGTLDLLILKIVALGPLHGYAIAQRLQQISRDVVQVQQGTLYPALHRLGNRGYLSAEWKALDTGRDAKIYSVEVVVPERRAQLPSLPVTVQAFQEWRKTGTGFAVISALTPWECNLTGDAEPEHVGAARVSANFFSFLGVPISRGRDFTRDEERPGNERVVVISDSLWRRRYGSDPSVIGRTIVINGENHSVIGIARNLMLHSAGSRRNSGVSKTRSDGLHRLTPRC